MSLTEFLRDAFEEGWSIRSTWVKGYNVMMKLMSEDETKLIEFCANDFSVNTPVTLIVRKTTDDDYNNAGRVDVGSLCLIGNTISVERR